MALDTVSYLLGKKAGGGGGSNYQSKSVEITENGTTSITADTGYDALSNVNVTVSGILDTSDADAVASDMATGKIAYVNGTKITGNVPVGSSSVATNYASNNVGTYLDELKVDTEQGNQYQMFRTGDKISVYAPLSSVATTVGATAEKIKKDEVICGVTGTYEGSGGKYAPRNSIRFVGSNLSDMTYEVENLDTSNIIDMSSMFYNCPVITFGDFKDWNTSNVTSMEKMFYGCGKNITESFTLNIKNLDTSNVTNMSSMFYELNIWDVRARKFNGSNKLDISSFNTKKVTNLYAFCRSGGGLEHIYFGEDFELPLCTNMQLAFGSCQNLDDETLNAILHICATATSISSNKTLNYIGLTSTQATTCESLSNYQEFIDAGWTTGY